MPRLEPEFVSWPSSTNLAQAQALDGKVDDAPITVEEALKANRRNSTAGFSALVE